VRRSPGQCSIETRENGFRVRTFLPDGTRRVLGNFDTREEAVGFANAVTLEKINGENMVLTGVTLAAYGKRWLDRREADGKRNIRTDRSRWNLHIATAPFAQDPISSIDPKTVRDWVRLLMCRKAMDVTKSKDGITKKKANRCLSRETVKHCRNLLSVCLDEAVMDGLIPFNPAKAVKVPKQPRTDDTWTFLTLEEIEAVTTSQKIPEDKRLLFQFAIYSGLRAGEIFGLRWQDVYLEAEQPYIVVRRSFDGPTKSGKVRHMPLLVSAAQALKRWREISDSTGLVWPAKGGGCHRNGYDAGWSDVQTTEDGKVKHGWKRKAGITRKVRFHDLRHTCASHLISRSWGRAWRLEEVRDYLGHSNISVTQRYAHLSPRALSRAVSETLSPAVVPPSDAITDKKASGNPGIHNDNVNLQMARPAGFEPATVGLEGRCSIRTELRAHEQWSVFSAGGRRVQPKRQRPPAAGLFTRPAAEVGRGSRGTTTHPVSASRRRRPEEAGGGAVPPLRGSSCPFPIEAPGAGRVYQIVGEVYRAGRGRPVRQVAYQHVIVIVAEFPVVIELGFPLESVGSGGNVGLLLFSDRG
jgi:integrase